MHRFEYLVKHKKINIKSDHLRSPCVRAPRDSNLFATIDAKRFSPPRVVKRSLKMSQEKWILYRITSFPDMLNEVKFHNKTTINRKQPSGSCFAHVPIPSCRDFTIYSSIRSIKNMKYEFTYFHETKMGIGIYASGQKHFRIM